MHEDQDASGTGLPRFLLASVDEGNEPESIAWARGGDMGAVVGYSGGVAAGPVSHRGLAYFWRIRWQTFARCGVGSNTHGTIVGALAIGIAVLVVVWQLYGGQGVDAQAADEIVLCR